jgi:hypothetical protein
MTSSFGRRGASPPVPPAPLDDILHGGAGAPPPPGAGPAAGDPGVPPGAGRVVGRRVAFYAAVTVLAALGSIPVALIYGLMFFIAPAFLFMGAAYVLLYLPVVDWPLAAWRATRRPGVALAWLALALTLPCWTPLIANRLYDAEAEALLRHEMRPPAPVAVRHILIVESERCGEACRALLWSGAADHVLGVDRWRMNDPLDRAELYTTARGAACGAEPVASREGFCIVGRTISNPTFDAVITTPYVPRLGRERNRWAHLPVAPAPDSRLTLFRCDSECRPVASLSEVEGEKFAWPLGVHFVMQGLDSSFGMHVNKRPARWGDGDPASALKVAYGLDAAGFDPRPGFSGDVGRGNPGRLTPADLKRREQRRWDAARAADRARCEERRQEVLAGIAKWQAYREAHKLDQPDLQPSYQERNPPRPCR